MGKLFDSFNNVGEKSPIAKYLEERKFYRSTMNPTFLDGIGYDCLKLGLPCWQFNIVIKDGDSMSIYINDVDIYFEIANSCGSFCYSSRYDAKDYPNVEDIDRLLDEIIKHII